MLFARVLAACVWRTVAIVEKRFNVSTPNCFIHPGAEFSDIGAFRCIGRLPAKASKVMGKASRTNDQHTLFTQWREGTTDVQRVARAAGCLDRKLQHCDVRSGPGKHQWYPGTVVKTPGSVKSGWEAGGSESISDALRE